MRKKKLECLVVNQICTLWPLRFQQECFVFSMMPTSLGLLILTTVVSPGILF